MFPTGHNEVHRKIVDIMLDRPASYRSVLLTFSSEEDELEFRRHIIISRKRFIAQLSLMMTVVCSVFNVLWFASTVGSFANMSTGVFVTTIIVRVYIVAVFFFPTVVNKLHSHMSQAHYDIYVGLIIFLMPTLLHIMYQVNDELEENQVVLWTLVWGVNICVVSVTPRRMVIVAAMTMLTWAFSAVYDGVTGAWDTRRAAVLLVNHVVNGSTAVVLHWSMEYAERKVLLARIEARRALAKANPVTLLSLSPGSPQVLRPGAMASGPLVCGHSPARSPPATAVGKGSRDPYAEGEISVTSIDSSDSGNHTDSTKVADEAGAFAGDGAEMATPQGDAAFFSSSSDSVGEEVADDEIDAYLDQLASAPQRWFSGRFQDLALEAEFRRVVVVQSKHLFQFFILIFLFAHICLAFLDVLEMANDASWILALRMAYGVPIFIFAYYSSQTLAFYHNMQSLLVIQMLSFLPFVLAAMLIASRSGTALYQILLVRAHLQNVVTFQTTEQTVRVVSVATVLATLAVSFFMAGGIIVYARFVLTVFSLAAATIKVGDAVNASRRKDFLLRRLVYCYSLVDGKSGGKLVPHLKPHPPAPPANPRRKRSHVYEAANQPDQPAKPVLVISTFKSLMFGSGTFFMRSYSITFKDEFLENEYERVSMFNVRRQSSLSFAIAAVTLLAQIPFYTTHVAVNVVFNGVAAAVCLVGAIAIALLNPAREGYSAQPHLLMLFMVVMALFLIRDIVVYTPAELASYIGPGILGIWTCANLLIGLKFRLLMLGNGAVFVGRAAVYIWACSATGDTLRGFVMCAWMFVFMVVVASAAMMNEMSSRRLFLAVANAHHGCNVPLWEMISRCNTASVPRDMQASPQYNDFLFRSFVPQARNLVPFILVPSLMYAVQDAFCLPTGSPLYLLLLLSRLAIILPPASVSFLVLHIRKLSRRLPTVWLVLSAWVILGSMVPVVVSVVGGASKEFHSNPVGDELSAISLAAIVAFSSLLLTKRSVAVLTFAIVAFVVSVGTVAEKPVGVIIAVLGANLAAAQLAFLGSGRVQGAFLAHMFANAGGRYGHSFDHWISHLCLLEAALAEESDDGSEVVLRRGINSIAVGRLDATNLRKSDRHRLGRALSRTASESRVELMRRPTLPTLTIPSGDEDTAHSPMPSSPARTLLGRRKASSVSPHKGGRPPSESATSRTSVWSLLDGPADH